MGNELTQFQKDLIRMWDSLRAEVFKGVRTCAGVLCSKCPFNDTVCNTDDANALFNAEKAVEVVAQWAKEHPIITMKDKYKETFGVEPNVCPKTAGFDIGKCVMSSTHCAECIRSFWNSEYKKWKVNKK